MKQHVHKIKILSRHIKIYINQEMYKHLKTPNGQKTQQGKSKYTVCKQSLHYNCKLPALSSLTVHLKYTSNMAAWVRRHVHRAKLNVIG